MCVYARGYVRVDVSVYVDIFRWTFGREVTLSPELYCSVRGA